MRFALDNGVRVMVVQVADAPRQTTFTFLPLSLATDDRDRAQWSHLLEHMLIRSTDPFELQVEGMMLNGETSPEFMRLEAIAEAEHARESLLRHARWIIARDFDAETLEREKVNIAGEETVTAANSMTHKFAVAAWCQAILHGGDHAAVHGDVAEAGVEDVEHYARAGIAIDESILIATIGPMSSEDVRAALRDFFAENQTDAAPPPKNPINRADDDLARELAITWDLPTRHVLLWWLVPDDNTATRAAAIGAANHLTMRFAMKPLLANRSINALAYALRIGDLALIMVNVNVPAETEVDALRKELRDRVKEAFDSPRSVRSTLQMMLFQVKAVPDFARMRGQTPEQWRHLVEAQWLLQRGAAEYHWRATMEEIMQTVGALNDETIERVAETLRAEPSGSLIIAPREE